METCIIVLFDEEDNLAKVIKLCDDLPILINDYSCYKEVIFRTIKFDFDRHYLHLGKPYHIRDNY